MITVYTKPMCVQCDQTKKLLTKNGLKFETVDITVDTEAFDMIVAKGFKAAPVVNAGDEWWAGFDPAKINSIAKDAA